MATNGRGVTEPIFTDTLQVGIVVRELERAMRTYVDDFGIGPWEVFEMNPSTVDELFKDDEPSDHAMRVALAMVGNVQWELIEPVSGDNIYSEWLEQHGEGLHHLGLAVKNYDEAVERLRSRGHTLLQGGVFNGARYAYPSTQKDLRFITEIFDFPDDFSLTPDSVYPPQD